MRISDWSSDVCSSDLNPPIVQRAGDRAAMDDALAQPPMLVRAAVKEREDLAFGGAEDRNVVAARDLHGAATAHGDFIDPANVEPFSDHAISSCGVKRAIGARSEEHTSELQSLMRHSYAVFCLKKK